MTSSNVVISKDGCCIFLSPDIDGVFPSRKQELFPLLSYLGRPGYSLWPTECWLPWGLQAPNPKEALVPPSWSYPLPKMPNCLLSSACVVRKPEQLCGKAWQRSTKSHDWGLCAAFRSARLTTDPRRQGERRTTEPSGISTHNYEKY